MKVYYKESFLGYNIYTNLLHPLNNSYVDCPDYDLDKLKLEVKRRFNQEDIELEEGGNWMLS